jgi:hypothetical protein
MVRSFVVQVGEEFFANSSRPAPEEVARKTNATTDAIAGVATGQSE